MLSSLKRLLFASESVVKSAAEKTGEYVKETVSEVVHKVQLSDEESVVPKTERTAGLKDSILEKAEHGLDKALDFADELVDKTKVAASELGEKVDQGMEQLAQNENVKKAMEFTEKVGDKVLTTGEEFVDKAKSFTEKVGARVMEEGGDLAEKAKSLSESIGEKVLAAKDQMVEKAKEAAHNLEEKFEELKEKAVQAEAEEAAKPKKEFADTTLDASKPLLDDKDDFFSKASKYAEGKYDAFSETSAEVKPETPKDVPPVELPGEDAESHQ
ncbi:MAG: hypothetical protein IPN29_10165 [Saprospiraceae bacterium]|nr:hypothetical protein [Saprospiraceae bacterium]